MKGIELSKAYYEEYFEKLILGFPHYMNRVAVGIVGRGSECFGFDDEISKDHDFAAGFCLWLRDNDYKNIGKELQYAYEQLPKSFRGVSLKSGQNKYGVESLSGFLIKHTGRANLPQRPMEWLNIPEYALAEACNGNVFHDPLGEFSQIRKGIMDYSEPVRLQRLSAHLCLAAQSGQYNYARCIAHGEEAAAQLAINEFVKHIIHITFNLNRAFTPFYKWQFKALKNLKLLSSLQADMERLLCQKNSPKATINTVEGIAEKIIQELKDQGLSQGTSNYLEEHGINIRQKIQDAEIKALHPMEFGAED